MGYMLIIYLFLLDILNIYIQIDTILHTMQIILITLYVLISYRYNSIISISYSNIGNVLKLIIFSN